MKGAEKRMIDIKTVDLFTDEAFIFKMPDHNYWKENIKSIVLVEDNKNLHNYSTSPDDECNVKAKRTAWDSHLRYNIVRNFTDNVSNIILSFVKAKNFDAPKIQVLDSWINWYSKNDYAAPHSHVGLLSLVYFVDVKKTNAKFVFHKDTKFQLVNKENLNTNYMKTIEVIDGDVLMFGSNLNHSVTANTTNKKRITLAANFAVDYFEERKDY